MGSYSSYRCIGCKFSHKVAPFALETNLATRWRHLYCHIAQYCPISFMNWYWVSIFISQSHIS